MVRFRAHFDGEHLLPDEPVALPEGTPLEVTVQEVEAATALGPIDLAAWLNRMEAEVGLADGPSDLSAELDHYLYGAAKRSDGNGG